MSLYEDLLFKCLDIFGRYLDVSLESSCQIFFVRDFYFQYVISIQNNIYRNEILLFIYFCYVFAHKKEHFCILFFAVLGACTV